MDERDEDETGYLTAYGVLIVPPSSRDGGWFVALAEWDEDAERYRASMDGPMYDTQDQAFDTARELLGRIEASGDNDDLMKLWETLQAEEMSGEPWSQRPPELPPPFGSSR